MKFIERMSMKRIILATVVCVSVFCGCDKPQKHQKQQSRIAAYCENFTCGEVQDLLDGTGEVDEPNVLTCSVNEIRRYEAEVQKAEQKMRSLCVRFVRGADALHCSAEERLVVEYVAAEYIRGAERRSKRAASMVALVEFLAKNRANLNMERWDDWCEGKAPLFDNLTLQFEFEDMLESCGIDPIMLTP